MGIVDLLLGVIFAAGIAFGIGLGAMGDASGIEFWIARSGFTVSALAVAGAFWWWWGEGSKPLTHIIVLGIVTGLWVFVAYPLQLMWIQSREDKISALEAAAHPKPPPAPVGPDVTARFIYPDFPALVLVNNSDKLARDIKWSVAVWNLDDPRTYVNQNPAPDAHDPLPIPVSTFDFIRPHSSGGPQMLFGGPPARPFLKEGQRLFGSVSVICPDCVRGHTYFLYVEVGKGGWFTEVVNVTNGELIYPPFFTKQLVQQFYETTLAQIPQDRRIPISAR